MIGVYIKVDEQNNVTAINSSIFIDDVSDWILIDEGEGDKYAHCQSAYLNKGIIDEYGRYNFKFVDGEIVEIPEEDKPSIDEPIITSEMRLIAMENALEELIEMLMEE